MTVPASRRRSPVDWYLPSGRLRRRDLWLRYVLVFVVLGLVAAWLDARLFPSSLTSRGVDGEPDLFWFLPARGGPVLGATAVVLLVPYLGATVTRLHDRDHSAGWLLWLLLGPVGVLVLGITAGLLGTQPHSNRYGPPPPG